MKFILYSHFGEDTVRQHLGEPEYSYYFVLKAYQRVLAELGSVEIVRHPETEVDPIYNACRSHNEPCVFLPFSPPDKIPLDLECPTVPVIAWEFSTIPNEPWDNEPRNDWTYSLAKCRGAITLSSYTARTIAQTMGPNFIVGAVPAPIPDQANASTAMPARAGADFQPTEVILDTASINLDIDTMAPGAPPRADNAPAKINRYQLVWRRCLIWALAHLEEFSKSAKPNLPQTPDSKTALSSDRDDLKSNSAAQTQVDISGIVYTAVLTPNSGRKNLHDLVTAFCWAFKDIEDATLVLKLVTGDLRHFYNVFIPLLYQLSPFKCRVLAVQGFLEDGEYAKLRQATSYYVNASTSEGLCLPLMEFMTSGTPAIAPVHTAMEDYIDDGVAFTLRATLESTVWPQDSRELFRTMCYRLDWGSLVEAYRQSYRLAKHDPDAYSEMSKRARQRMQHYASPSVVKDKLRHLLSMIEESTAADLHKTAGASTRQSTASEHS